MNDDDDDDGDNNDDDCDDDEQNIKYRGGVEKIHPLSPSP